LEIPEMKALSIFAVAILLGLTSTVMAGDSGENHQDNTNATGPNPYMTFSDGNYRANGYAAFAQHPVHRHVVKPHDKN
jgi:hypothetical protein